MTHGSESWRAEANHVPGPVDSWGPALAGIPALALNASAAVCEAFESAEAQRVLERSEFHYTLNHPSLLSKTEIELSALSGASECPTQEEV